MIRATINMCLQFASRHVHILLYAIGVGFFFRESQTVVYHISKSVILVFVQWSSINKPQNNKNGINWMTKKRDTVVTLFNNKILLKNRKFLFYILQCTVIGIIIHLSWCLCLHWCYCANCTLKKNLCTIQSGRIFSELFT